jgi:hypothetical protein
VRDQLPRFHSSGSVFVVPAAGLLKRQLIGRNVLAWHLQLSILAEKRELRSKVGTVAKLVA